MHTKQQGQRVLFSLFSAQPRFYAGATVCASRAILFALFVLACVTPAPAHATEKASSPAAVAPAQVPLLDESVVRKMMDRGKPSQTDEAKVLVQLLGTWSYKVAIWAAPGGEPLWSEGKITNEMVLEDRFMSSTFIGDLSVGGHEVMMKGQGLTGYDTAKKSFTSVWADTLTTGLMTGAGNYDKKANAIEETGEFTSPISGNVEKFRSELQFTDADHYKRTIFVIHGSGRETKLIEFDYTKK